mgnify:CR=1 FL=1
MPILCVCQYHPCSTSFYVKLSWVAKGKGKFCSRTCASAAKRIRIDRTCIQCGTCFSMTPSALRQGTGEFCSKRCRGDAIIAGFAERFWANIQRCEHDILCLYCCWPWQKFTGKSGHGRVGRASKVIIASRAAWELWHERSMFPELDAAHYCNNPACCNPSHIYAATRKQNIEDAIKAGTFIRQRLRPEGRSLEVGRHRYLVYMQATIPASVQRSFTLEPNYAYRIRTEGRLTAARVAASCTTRYEADVPTLPCGTGALRFALPPRTCVLCCWRQSPT